MVAAKRKAKSKARKAKAKRSGARVTFVRGALGGLHEEAKQYVDRSVAKAIRKMGDAGMGAMPPRPEKLKEPPKETRTFDLSQLDGVEVADFRAEVLHFLADANKVGGYLRQHTTELEVAELDARLDAVLERIGRMRAFLHPEVLTKQV